MTTNKQYDSNWALLPGIGLGKAVFDMTRLEVNALKDVLGEITGENNLLIQKEQLLATYDMLKDFFTEEDLKTVMEALDETGAQRGFIEMEYRTTGQTLEYEDGKLTEFLSNKQDQSKDITPSFSTEFSTLSLRFFIFF